MRTLIILLVWIAGSFGARSEIFKSVCTSESSGTSKTFSIIADSIKKDGSTNYRNADMRIGEGRERSILKLLSLQYFADGLVGIKLFDPASGAKYRLDFIRAKRPANSPYKPNNASVAISARDGTTTHESCRSE